MSDLYTQISEALTAMRRTGIPIADYDAEYATSYMEYFWELEDADKFSCGYCDFPDRKALIYMHEAMKMLCAQQHEWATRLLALADAEMRNAGLWPGWIERTGLVFGT